jgi:hypothetical protein
MHKLLVIAGAAGVGFAPAALAQTKTTPSTSAQPGDAAAKFKTADKNNSGTLEAAEADAYKAKMAQVDTNKDGKIFARRVRCRDEGRPHQVELRSWNLKRGCVEMWPRFFS